MDPRIGLLRWLELRLRGYVYLGDRIMQDWKCPLPFYVFKCPVHGYVENYPQGYSDTLVCPKCMEELREGQDEKAYEDTLLMDSVNEAIREVPA